MSEHQADGPQLLPYSLYIKIWLTLLLLTGLTIWVSSIELYRWHVFTAMLIATVKVSLVILYFMHVRFENKLIWIMILAVLITYAIFVGLTFADYYYR
jgi:cytochrome c oxidase subunit 4